jgi:hypothetical protein
VGPKSGQNRERGNQRPDGKTRSREWQEKNGHDEQPNAGAHGEHSHNIRQNDVSRISSHSDKKTRALPGSTRRPLFSLD